MRVLACVVALLVVAAASADAKSRPFKTKRATTAKSRSVTRGWHATAKFLPSAPLDGGLRDEAPVEPAGVPAERPAAVAPPPPASAPLCDPSPWLGLTAEDVNGFRLRLTRKCVPAGTVLFQYRNADLSSHNLWAEGVSPARSAREVVELAEGETTVKASADLAAGKWRLYCSLAGHEAMTKLVDVTPASR